MSIGGCLGLGWLSDKVDRRWVAAGAFVIAALGMLCFAYVSSAVTWLLIPFLVLFGIGYGGINSVRPSLGRDYFGRANFGTIFGLIVGINMLGSMAGPPLAGWVYDNWASYQGIWLVFAGLPIAALISILNISQVRAVVESASEALP